MAKSKDTIQTSLWTEYNKIKQFNESRNLFNNYNLCWEMYNGDQWKDLESGDVEPVSLNILKPMVEHKAAVVNENEWAIVYNCHKEYQDENERKQYEDALKVMNEKSKRTFTYNQLDTIKGRQIGKAGFVVGEGITYSWYDEDEDMIKVELIQQPNIMYGNENDSRIQTQPRIMIEKRMSPKKAKELCDKYKNPEAKEFIVGDDIGLEKKDNNYGKYEVDQKVTVIYDFKRNDEGFVTFEIGTQSAMITPKPQETKEKLYPFAKFLKEDVINSARGQGDVLRNIPNQIEINKNLMRRSIAIRLTAFPRLAYNKKRLSNPGALNDISKAFELNDEGMQGIRSIVDYITPASISTDAEKYQEMLMSETRNLEFAGDSATGEINPEQASGTAILAVQNASKQPLTEIKERYMAFLEELGKIWLELWRNNAKNMNVIIEESENNQLINKEYKINKGFLKKLEAEVSVDVTPTSAYDKLSQDMTLIDMFTNGMITMEELVDVIGNDSGLPKKALEKVVKSRQEKQRMFAEMQQKANQIETMANKAMAASQISNEAAVGGQAQQTMATQEQQAI